MGDEGGFAPNLKTNEEPLEPTSCKAVREGRLTSPAPTSCSPWIRPPPSSTTPRPASTCSGRRGPSSCTSDEMVDYWEALVEQVPHRLHRGRHGRGGLGRLEEADRPHRRSACSWWATTCSSPTPSASPRASSWAAANAILIKVNQIGYAHRDARGHRDGQAGRLRLRHEPPLRRDRGRPPSPIWSVALSTPARSRRAPRAAADRVAKYNQLIRIEEQLEGQAQLRRHESFLQHQALEGRAGARSPQGSPWKASAQTTKEGPLHNEAALLLFRGSQLGSLLPVLGRRTPLFLHEISSYKRPESAEGTRG